MAQDLEVLVAQLSADVRNYERGMRRAQLATNTAMQRIEQRAGRMTATVSRQFQQMSRLAVGALGAIGVALSARAFGRMVSDSLQAAEALSDMATQANASIEGLQELRFVADQSGSSAATLDRGLRVLSATMGDVMRGKADNATRAMDHLGLSQRILTGEIRTTDQVFLEMVRALEGVEDANVRASLSGDILGRRLGAELNQALSQGSEAVDRLRARSNELGLVLRDDIVRQGALANAQLRALGQGIRTQVTGAILEASPALVQLMSQIEAMIPVLAQWAVNVGNFMSAAFGEGQRLSNPAQSAQLLEDLAGRYGRGETVRLSSETVLGGRLHTALGNQGGIALHDEIQELIRAERDGTAQGIERGRIAAMGLLRQRAEELRREARELEERRQQMFSLPGFNPDPEGESARGMTDAERAREAALSLARERLALEFALQEAQGRGDTQRAQELERQIALHDRIQSYRAAEIVDAERLAEEDHRRLMALEDNARAQELINQRIEAQRDLQDEQLNHEYQLARLRGDDAAIRQLERELFIRERINDLLERNLGLTAGQAGDIATREADAVDYARLQGNVRDEVRRGFRDGLLGALDGNAKEAFSNWMRDAATRGMGRALDALADQFVDIFMRPGGGGGGIVGSIANIFGFGGNRMSGGPVRAGTAYRVGERGPEMFVPTQNGSILPNPSSLPQVGGRGVQVVQQFHLHAEGAVMTEDLIREMDMKAANASSLAVETARRVIPSDLSRQQRRRLR